MSEPIVIVDSDDEATPSTSTATATMAPTAADTAQKEPTYEASSSSSSTDREQMECPICLQTCIHPARLPCGHIFCFLCVKGVAYKNRRCAMCRREIPVEFLDHPHLLYKIEDTAPTTEDGYQWFYEGRNGWWQYDERTSQEIEDAYKRPDKFCTILVAGYVYVVDFETMLQQRQNEPSRKRQVKRDLATIPKKGVAGLRIDGTAEPHESSALSASSSAASSFVASTGSGPAPQYPTQPYNAPPAVQTRSPLPALVANNLISTIAATDAAIRIASDIIDSTLAHASTDSTSHSSYDYRDHRGGGIHSGSGSSNGGPLQSSNATNNSSASLLSSSRQDLLNEVQEALNMSGGGGAATANASTSPRLDFFSQTIDEFRSLALSNIAESSTESDDDDDDEDDVDDDDGSSTTDTPSMVAGGTTNTTSTSSELF